MRLKRGGGRDDYCLTGSESKDETNSGTMFLKMKVRPLRKVGNSPAKLEELTRDLSCCMGCTTGRVPFTQSESTVQVEVVPGTEPLD